MLVFHTQNGEFFFVFFWRANRRENGISDMRTRGAQIVGKGFKGGGVSGVGDGGGIFWWSIVYIFFFFGE